LCDFAKQHESQISDVEELIKKHGKASDAKAEINFSHKEMLLVKRMRQHIIHHAWYPEAVFHGLTDP
jgi:hypothetical protein